MRAATIMLVSTLLFNAGCSWIGVRRVDDGWEPSKPLDCTSGRATPIIDSVGAGLSILLAIVGLVTAAGPECRDITGNIGMFGPVEQCVNTDRALGLGLGALALGTLYMVSSVNGFCWTGTCRESTRLRDEWVRARQKEVEWAETRKAIAEWGVDRLGVAVSLFGEREVRTLIKRGADVNQRDEYGRTPMHWAVEEGKLEVVDLLASEGADINARDGLDMTPLQLARVKTPSKADRVRDILAKYGNPE